jgi:Ca2+-binding RTX toxin-like protein
MLQGLDGGDTLFGNAGEDILIGNGGDDMLCSGDGDDVITGNRGSDTIEGQGGDDWVSGDYSNDTIFGNDGEDTVLGGRGEDVVSGNQGNDVLYGGIVTGVPLEAEDAQALAEGGSLADILAANGQEINMRDDMRQDEIYGGGGEDTMFVGGMDNAYGGTGSDTFNIMADHMSMMSSATVQDFEPGSDNIGIVVNDGDEDMEISVSEDGEDAIVMGDGVELARVLGAAGELTAAGISVMSESSVAGLLDPNA